MMSAVMVDAGAPDRVSDAHHARRNRRDGRASVQHSPMIVELVIVVLLILLNAFFAMSELALVNARRARLQGMAESGHRGARAALALAEDPSRLLSTVQVGITLIGIFAG